MANTRIQFDLFGLSGLRKFVSIDDKQSSDSLVRKPIIQHEHTANLSTQEMHGAYYGCVHAVQQRGYNSDMHSDECSTQSTQVNGCLEAVQWLMLQGAVISH